ncbi:hypothetical protein SAMN05421863_10772 [Nitrosomonas communis]|uniref:Uncharacterized protein n=1 Tax=Nitrosomonas communis TaxID=44574 RepID=A0A1I4V6T7_9PROT|nr:hypothetical protein SAMN05421863_10772 [Nitrosomonas communis]
MKRDMNSWEPIETMPANRTVLLYYSAFGQVTNNIRKFIEFRKQLYSARSQLRILKMLKPLNYKEFFRLYFPQP